ncbi:MerR family transcriptional regulator [Dactylosporangium sp. NPDC051485]|uniref:MerR family transcriptional regulator n=1 Tax=Dactylosporangium sp. NPDC051485 TaxID=3154846 RepID=UPI00343339F9
MRISDLSRQAGVSIPTIKFYLRERLLPPGTATGRNQAAYGEVHLRRLELIKALTQIGQLELTTVRQLLAAIEDHQQPLPQLYELVDQAHPVPEPAPGSSTEHLPGARSDVDTLLDDLGWQVGKQAPARERLTAVIATLRRLGCDCRMEFFNDYAAAAETQAVKELDLLPADGVGADRAAAVVRSVLLAAAMAALRRMAQEHYVSSRFGLVADHTGPRSA